MKQLVFNLTIAADGSIPLHYKTYSGNRTDDTIHIETWNDLKKLMQRCDFLYVADSKLCTDKQLHHIQSHGGRALTILPRTWSEVKNFEEKLRNTELEKKEIWRRIKPNTLEQTEYFSVYQGVCSDT